VTTSTRGATKTGVAVALGTLALVAAACSGISSSPTTTTAAPAAPTTTTAPPLPTTVIPTQPANAVAAAGVPAPIRSAGTLTVAMAATYPPNEFIAPDGSTIVGMDVDLTQAVTQTLGLRADLVNTSFDTIIPGIDLGRYGMGASSITDTRARRAVVQFVDYFSAGESFYVKTGGASFNGIGSLCGHSVAVERGTTEETGARVQSARCTAAGKPGVDVLTFRTQGAADLAVSSGRADLGFADSPVAAYIVASSNGAFQNSGSPFDVAPYGLALPKGNGMAAPVQAAVDILIADGVYNQILTKWGVEAGAVTTATVDGSAG
jgi:polar amino acid transport system substrate-binding protein